MRTLAKKKSQGPEIILFKSSRAEKVTTPAIRHKRKAGDFPEYFCPFQTPEHAVLFSLKIQPRIFSFILFVAQPAAFNQTFPQMLTRE